MIRIMAPYAYVTIAFSFLLFTTGQAIAADEYRVDDGTAEKCALSFQCSDGRFDLLRGLFHTSSRCGLGRLPSAR